MKIEPNILNDLITNNKELNEKTKNFVNGIKKYKKAVIAYSGGIDSTLLALIATKILKKDAFIITIKSQFLPESELKDAVNFAQQFDFNHKILEVNILENKQIIANAPLRCKYCKEEIIKKLSILKQEIFAEVIFDGSNFDDKNDYRPGFEAAKKLGVKSPFLESGITKPEIRELAKLLALPNWNKPASACLASRIPYNTEITEEILLTVEQSEDFIKNLGYSGFRVRHFNNEARLEINPDDMQRLILKDKDIIVAKLLELGYKNVFLDLKGYRTGSLNEVLKNAK